MKVPAVEVGDGPRNVRDRAAGLPARRFRTGRALQTRGPAAHATSAIPSPSKSRAANRHPAAVVLRERHPLADHLAARRVDHPHQRRPARVHPDDDVRPAVPVRGREPTNAAAATAWSNAAYSPISFQSLPLNTRTTGG